MKTGILILITIISIGHLRAQGVIIGISGSYNSTWIEYQQLYGEINDNGISRFLDYKYTPGYSFGLAAGYNFTDHSTVLALPAYSSQGQDYKTSINGYTITRSVKLTYIKLPVVYKYTKGNDLAKFYFCIGGECNILKAAEITASYHGQSDNGNHKGADALKRFNALDPSIILALGGEFKISGPVSFTAGLRGDNSIVDNNAPGYRFANPHGGYRASRNAAVGIEVGLLFNLARGQRDEYRYFEK